MIALVMRGAQATRQSGFIKEVNESMASPDINGFDQLRELGQLHAQQKAEQAELDQAIAEGRAEVVVFQMRPGESREALVARPAEEAFIAE